MWIGGREVGLALLRQYWWSAVLLVALLVWVWATVGTAQAGDNYQERQVRALEKIASSLEKLERRCKQ